MTKFTTFAQIVFLLALIGCNQNTVHTKSTPAEKTSPPTSLLDLSQLKWSAAQLEMDVAIQPYDDHTEENHSQFIVRLKGKEKPHYHDYHDLHIQVLSGQAIIHYAERTQKVTAGDTIVIPKGTYHWAENTGTEASVVLATFTPKLKGKDIRLAH